MTAYIDRDLFKKALEDMSKDYKKQMVDLLAQGNASEAAMRGVIAQTVDGIVLGLTLMPSKEIES